MDLDTILTKKDLLVDDCALVYTMLMNLSSDGSSMISPLASVDNTYFQIVSGRSIRIKSAKLTEVKSIVREFIKELIQGTFVSEVTTFIDTLEAQTPSALGKMLGQKGKTVRDQFLEKIISLAKEPYKTILTKEQTSGTKPLSDFVYKLFIIYKGLTKCSLLCGRLSRDVPKLSADNPLRQHPLVEDPKICNFLRDTIPLLTSVGTQAYTPTPEVPTRGGKTRRNRKSRKTRKH